MELVPAGVPLSFEVTFDSAGLHVAMSVYDDSGSSPVLLLSPFAMTLVSGYTYRAKFTPAANKSYIIIKAVYTNGLFTTYNPDYSQGSESIYAENLAVGGSQPCSVVGSIDACGCGGNPVPFELFTGDEVTMSLKAITGGCASNPLDLTNCTEIDVALPNADGTFTHLLLTEGDVAITAPSLLGRFTAVISAEVSDVLNPGEFQNFNVIFTISGKKFTVPFFKALSVFEQG